MDKHQMEVPKNLDGREVRALTLYDWERDIPPRRIQGKLTRRYVSTLDYWQYFVGGEDADPRTIELRASS
jgi:hypothetical protein